MLSLIVKNRIHAKRRELNHKMSLKPASNTVDLVATGITRFAKVCIKGATALGPIFQTARKGDGTGVERPRLLVGPRNGLLARMNLEPPSLAQRGHAEV